MNQAVELSLRADTYRSELVRLKKELASVQADIARQDGAASSARAEAARKRKAASDTKSVSMMQSHPRAAEQQDKKTSAAEKKIGAQRSKMASIAEKQVRAERHLETALKAERAASDRAEQQRRWKEKATRDALAREDGRRRQKEKDHAREISRLSSVTIRHVVEREPEPAKLRVLYLTSSPPDEVPLRVDAEVNNVLRALRSAKHRDLIELHPRPAATPRDLVDGINDLRPHVIHFSGHGGPTGVLFDNASLGSAAGRGLGFPELARLLAATDSPPTLVVLNACETIDGALPLLSAVPAVIAMSDSVGDMSAGLFATYFYAALGGAQSIGHAVEQARALVAIALPDEPDLVEVRTAEGVDMNSLMLVRPV